MPDSRLSINALVNGPLPTTSSSAATSPTSSSNSPTSLSFVTWTRDSELPRAGGSPEPRREIPPLAPLTTSTPSPTRVTPPSPAPSSPQTVIVKTPRGKRHRCTFRGCGRDFTRLSNLKAHWRRHSGEEPYACMHCTRKFKWRSSLKSHELGCVYEFTKANSGLRWVYVSTDQRGVAQPQPQMVAKGLQMQPQGPSPIHRPVIDDCARRSSSLQYPLGFGAEPLRPSTMLGPMESRSYV